MTRGPKRNTININWPDKNKSNLNWVKTKFPSYSWKFPDLLIAYFLLHMFILSVRYLKFWPELAILCIPLKHTNNTKTFPDFYAFSTFFPHFSRFFLTLSKNYPFSRFSRFRGKKKLVSTTSVHRLHQTTRVPRLC